MFINNLRNLQNLHIYISLSLYFLCNLAVQNRLSKIRILHPDTQKRFEIWKTNGRNGVKRRNEEGGEGKRKRRFPVVGRKGTREKRAKKRKCCKAWERASPLAERGHPRSRERERERISQTGLRFHPSPKTHPNFHPRSTPGRLDAQRWPPSWLGGHRVPR